MITCQNCSEEAPRTGNSQRYCRKCSTSRDIARKTAHHKRHGKATYRNGRSAISRPDIARLVGVNKPSWGSYFQALYGRPLPWWNEQAFKRVVDAVMDCEPPEPPAAVRSKNVARDPDRGAPIGRLESGGFRPAPGTYENILADDKAAHGPPRTALDRFADRGGGPADHHADGSTQIEGRAREARQCRDILAEAAANTAKLQAKLPPEKE